MPTMRTSDGCTLNYRLDGGQDKPLLMMFGSLGYTLSMWDPQIDALTRHFQVLCCDCRGHGESDCPPGPYSIERLARDAIEILDSLGIEKTDFCGLSIGGMVGMWLGANAPTRLRRLVLANTSSYLAKRELLLARLALIESEGMHAVVDEVLHRSLTEPYRQSDPATAAWTRSMLEGMSSSGYIAGGRAVLAMDQRAILPGIEVPTLVIAGRTDTATPPEMGKAVAEAIPAARFELLEAAHLSNIERAEDFSRLLIEFLA